MNRVTGIGTSLVLLAAGAILAFAVDVDADGFNLNTIGWILMGIGLLGLILTLLIGLAALAVILRQWAQRRWRNIDWARCRERRSPRAS